MKYINIILFIIFLLLVYFIFINIYEYLEPDIIIKSNILTVSKNYNSNPEIDLNNYNNINQLNLNNINKINFKNTKKY